MIRAYFKVLDVEDLDGSVVVELAPVKDGYSHIANDEDLEKVEIFKGVGSFKVQVDKNLKRQFVVGKISMVDWFTNCPIGWEK